MSEINKKKGHTNRRKGHDLERLWVKFFKSIGFKFSKSTRQESTLLDSCGVDITNIPFLIQCKAGYPNSYPKYDQEWEYTKFKLQDNFPEKSHYHDLPFMLIHKLDYSGKSKPYRHYVSMDNETFRTIIKEYYEMIEIIKSNKIEYEITYN